MISRALQERYAPAISFDNSALTAITIYSRIRKLPPLHPYCQIECEYDPPLKGLCSLPLVVNRSFYSEAPVSSHLIMIVDTSTHMLQPCRSNWTPSSSPEHQLGRRAPEAHRKLVMSSPWVEQLTHFVCERVISSGFNSGGGTTQLFHLTTSKKPESQIHAKGFGTHGYSHDQYWF